MIIFVLCVNAIAICTCCVAAVMSFRNDHTATGICMIGLVMLNFILFAMNAGR